MTLQYITCCVDSTAADICPMVERARQITYRTLRRHVGAAALAETFPAYDWRRRPHDLTMRRDFAVSYYKSVYRGRPVYYVRWSAIEFIFG